MGNIKENRFLRFLKVPTKILARARDLYVQSLSGCAGDVAYSYGMGCPMQRLDLPRSFSSNASSYSNYSNSRDEDMRELIRVASARTITGKTEAEILRRSSSEGAKLRRSRSTFVVSRIDEDKPCDQFVDVKKDANRSKSCVLWRENKK